MELIYICDNFKTHAVISREYDIFKYYLNAQLSNPSGTDIFYFGVYVIIHNN